jgi:hypothetical protein
MDKFNSIQILKTTQTLRSCSGLSDRGIYIARNIPTAGCDELSNSEIHHNLISRIRSHMS